MEDGRQFALSLSQQNIMSLEQRYPGTSINIISATIGIHGRIDFEKLCDAVNIVLSSDETLRSRLINTESGVFQKVFPFEYEKFSVYDFSQTDAYGFECWENAMAKEPMQLFDAPLYRVFFFSKSETEAGILFKLHHVISDGWSEILVSDKISQAYLSLLDDCKPEIKFSPSYEIHVNEELEYLSSNAYDKDLRYWDGLFSNPSDPAIFKKRVGANTTPVGKRSTYKLSETSNHLIWKFCQINRVSPFIPFCIALAIAAKRLGNGNKMVIGVPIHNRSNVIAKETTGMFVSTLPFVIELNEDWTIDEFNENLSMQWMDLLKHQRIPFEKIESLPNCNSGRLFDVVFSYQDSLCLSASSPSASFSGKWSYSGYQAEQLCIHMTNLEANMHYQIDYDYLIQILSEEEIAHIHKVICMVMDQILTHPERKIREVNIISPAEKEQIIYTFNNSDAPKASSNIWRSFCKIAESYPSRAAIIDSNATVTASRLMDLAKTGAVSISGYLTGKEPLVAILLPRSTELAKALMSVMAAGAAWVLLSVDYPKGRVQEIISTSGACLVITDDKNAERFETDEFAVPVLRISEMYKSNISEYVDVEDKPNQLAYVVYTSGSTGTPKGVEISRRNLANFALGMKDYFSSGAMLSLVNVSFDAFVLESVVSMLNGVTVVFASESEAENPNELARLIRRYGVDYICSPPSRIGTYIEYPDFQAALATMKGILCGGEAFSGEMVVRLRNLTEAHLYNQYGPSEATVGVSVDELDTGKDITVGRPMKNCRLYVLDDRLMPVPIGQYGELYIGGENVGRGYRNEPEMTANAFLPSPFEYGETIYKTGDVATWSKDGRIKLGGRMDRQLKIRGQRIEPNEIEACLERHHCVKKAIVRTCEQFGQVLLVAYYTEDYKVSEIELLRYLADRLPVYMIPSRIIRLLEFPVTSRGKIDDKALPLPEIKHESSEPTTEKQKSILEIFRKVLNNSEIGADSDYFLFGGNSLNAMETVGLLEPIMGKRMRVSDLYACRTARMLESWVDEKAQDSSVSFKIERTGVRAFYPTSEMQNNIFVQTSICPESCAYNMPGVFALNKAPDLDRLTAAFKDIIEKDDIYRTAFVLEKGKLMSRVVDYVDFELEKITGSSMEQAWDGFVRPFNLSCPPLIRAGVWVNNDNYYLFVDVHHIVGDGVSTPLLLNRLNDAYITGMSKVLELTYKDYCCWRENLDVDKAASDWKNHLGELPESMDLPTDYSRPHPFDFKGDAYTCVLPSDIARRCEKICEEKQLTLFMLFSAAYGLLLSKISGKNEIMVGTPVSGRSHGEMWDICGPFLATLPMRLSADKNIKVNDYLESVKQEILWLLDHQEFPMDRVLTEMGVKREVGENSLYQVMFVYRPLDVSDFTFDGEKLDVVDMPHKTAKAELSIECAQTADEYSFTFEYASSLFERKTIELYGRCMIEALKELTEKPDAVLYDLDLVSEYDKEEIVHRTQLESNHYEVVPVDVAIKNMAKVNSDRTAVIFKDEAITYAQLEKRAEMFASLLQNAGVKSGECVGLCCKRTPDIFAGMLAILKNGCAYVPFLPDYPKARVEYMMSASKSRFILCDDDSLDLAKSIDGIEAVVMSETDAEFNEVTDRGELMYVLFTSGSTGKPKGVLISHRAATNYRKCVAEVLNNDDGNIFCITNMTFDIFQTEGLLPLSLGRTVVLADEDERTLPWKMAECMEKNDVTTMQITPSQFGLCMGNTKFEQAAGHLKLLILTGEATPSQLVNSISKITNAKLINLYGPTETTVYVSSSELKPDSTVTIGKPFENCRMYILDENRRSVMPTARGELYIAGDCLAEGYVGDSEKTAAVFVADTIVPGEIMYKSGDVARLKADGTIECLGRVDNQVKLNGLRIELDEINNAALDSGLVSQCATIIVKNNESKTCLRTFIVTDVDSELDVTDKVRNHMRQLLPVYMIPAEIVKLKEMPINTNGKVDTQVLKSYKTDKPSEVLSSIVPVSQGTESLDKTIRRIWENALDSSEISESQSFFEQGGTSLSALGVLSEYYSVGISMTLAEFYANPSLKDQMAVIFGEAKKADSKEQPSEIRGSETHTQMFAARPAPTEEPWKQSLPAKCVLITGPTGYLGVHIIYELVEGNLTEEIICLMRDGNLDRLKQALSFYFGQEWADSHCLKLKVIQGDIGKVKLGLNDTEYDSLCQKVETVFHTAADVRHYSSDSKAWMTNVYGTAHAAQFGLDAKAAFNHISTLSVSGEYIVRDKTMLQTFSESDFDIGQNWKDNIYVEGKFLAEQEVYTRINQGLCARVFRLGRLVGRNRDGKFQKNATTNAVYLVMRGIQAAGIMPESMSGMMMDFTPIDFCAKSIVTLANGPMPVCHIADPNMYSLADAVKSIRPDIEIKSDGEFAKRLAELSGKGKDAELAPLVDAWNRGMHDGPARISQNWDKTAAMLRVFGVDAPDSELNVRLKEYKMD